MCASQVLLVPIVSMIGDPVANQLTLGIALFNPVLNKSHKAPWRSLWRQPQTSLKPTSSAHYAVSLRHANSQNGAVQTIGNQITH